ncbi:Serine/threonine-protein kinase Nek6 [Capsicum baccatum]|uniref:NEK6-subfamily protein kinase n=1 Tax=Capsicum baccatum TaxID=33114 RepID=A0A2G2XBL7_CAPBA|nr:Serine/threonine-protein kinase Nek6 [Capsicum baccatum]
MVKIQWRHQTVDEATWEIESNMRCSYPQLFIDSVKLCEKVELFGVIILFLDAVYMIRVLGIGCHLLIMGCIYGKPSGSVKAWRDGQKKRELDKGVSAVGSKREKSFRVKDKSENGDIRVGPFDRKPNGSKKIGQGTYSSVYKARDLLNDKLVALKKVRFEKMDPKSIKFMGKEIVILRRLDHPNIIKLEGLVVSRTSCSLSRI